MEDMIAKILKVEDRAQEIVASAKRDQENLQKDLDKEIENLYSDIHNKEESKIKYLTDFENKESEKKLLEISENLKRQKKEIKEKYNANREAWISRIFENTVK
ncbi:MAG: hypothetical protein PUB42_05315 [Firmicutes bacterium]|nr:hypothetical protein [Bacillota bacterium]